MMTDQKIEMLLEQAKRYSHLQLELLKLRSIETLAGSASRLITKAVFFAMLLLCFFFLGTASAFYFSHLLGSNALGFLATGCILLVVLLVFFIFRRKLLIEPLRNKIIYALSDQENDEQD